MTITATVPRSDTLVEAGDVGSVTRTYSFEIFDQGDLEVTFESGGVISAPLIIGADYTVAGVGNNNGGSITLIGSFAGGLVLNDRWSLVRKIVKSRSADFQTAGPFLAATVNDQFDRVFGSLQEHQEALDRRLGFKDAVADLADEGGLLNLTILQRASQFLAFNSLGNLIVNSVTNPGTAVGVDETDTDVILNKLVSNNLLKILFDYRAVGHLPLGGGTLTGTLAGLIFQANTSLRIGGSGVIATGILDEDNMSSDSNVKLSSQQAIKKYVDDQKFQVKVGNFTRDISTASGTQAITGVGFTPVAVLFLSSITGNNNRAMAIGWSDGTTNVCVSDRGNVNDDFWTDKTDEAVELLIGASDNAQFTVTTLGSDGFTLTWVKNGSPTGTFSQRYLAIGRV